MAEKLPSDIFFPPEWYPQDGIMLTWPHQATDWAPILPEVEKTYLDLAREIIKREILIVVCHNEKQISNLFNPSEKNKIRFYEIPSDDTWSRDHGPITTFRNRTPVVNDFNFNGWGGKFNAVKDNEITGKLFRCGAFSSDAEYQHHRIVLEGGSIETDGEGTILTTSRCLLNENRNNQLSITEIETILKNILGARRFLWLDHGHLEGDDTDSHIDTLARFCDRNTICYVRCSDVKDDHYESLKKMEQQLQSFRTVNGESFRLIPLPMVPPRFDEEGRRLPATYANFLILNKAVLVPVYGVQEDDQAVRIIKGLLPGRNILKINCSSLIKQNGSLHCITMQIPKGFLS